MSQETPGGASGGATGGWASPSGSWTAPSDPSPAPPAPDPSPASPPVPSSAHAPGAGSSEVYPQEAYYARGWTAPVQPPAPRRPRNRRRVLVPLAAVVAAGALVGGVLGARYWADTRPLGDVQGRVSAAPRQLDAGHCIAELPSDGPLGRVPVVPCDQPHEAEVVGVHTYDDDVWPGQGAVGREAAAACEMDTAQEEAGARAVVWAPGEVAWGQGDRESLCLAWTPDGAVVGSWADGTPAP